MTESEMVGWYHQLNGHESEQTSGDREGQGSLACYSPLSFQGMAPSRPPTCKPHKHLILINQFLSTTVPLVEFFLC